MNLHSGENVLARRAADAAPAPIYVQTTPAASVIAEEPPPAMAEENVKSLCSARLGK